MNHVILSFLSYKTYNEIREEQKRQNFAAEQKEKERQEEKIQHQKEREEDKAMIKKLMDKLEQKESKK